LVIHADDEMLLIANEQLDKRRLDEHRVLTTFEHSNSGLLAIDNSATSIHPQEITDFV